MALLGFMGSSRFSVTLFCIAIIQIFLWSGCLRTVSAEIARSHMRDDVQSYSSFPSRPIADISPDLAVPIHDHQPKLKVERALHDLEVKQKIEGVGWWPGPGGIPPHVEPPVPQKYQEKGFCMMSGRASDDPSSSIPFAYDGPAFRANFSLDACPLITGDHCCDQTQYKDLVSNLVEAKTVFHRCPACVENFNRLFCLMACSPDQSVFNERQAVQILKNHTAVKETTYHVHPDFVKGLYDSCKDVAFGATGQSVLEVIFGAFSADEFLQAISDSSPYTLHFDLDSKIGVNPPHLKCEDSCTCNDCKPLCSPAPAPGLTAKSCNIGKISCRAFVLIVLYGIICILMFLFILAFKVTGHKFKNRSAELREFLERKVEKGETTFKASGVLSEFFKFHGKWVSRLAPLVILVCTVLAIGLSFGLLRIEFITEPEKLWSTSSSRTAIDKKFFDEHFSPFFRTEQVIITRKDGGQVIRNDTLVEVLELELMFQGISVPSDKGGNVGLEDLCFKPIEGQGCSIQSPLEYFQEDMATLLNPPKGSVWDQIHYCADTDHLTNAACRSHIGAITEPDVVFGGFEDSQYGNSTAVVVTYLLNNHNDQKENKDAERWERVMLDILENRNFETINVFYMTERSVEDELSRETASDAVTIAISYVVMFIYICLALGEALSFSPRRFLLQSRVGVAVIGILIVSLSVTSSVGFCALCGIKATLIISEVIPFLVLAIGTDNIFIITHAFDRTDPSLPTTERVSTALSWVGSSITCAALAETFAFLLGSLTRMPAVMAFAYYTAMAIFFDFVLQMTVYPAVLSINERRASAGRPEIIPCVQMKPYRAKESLVHIFARKFYVPVLLHPYMKFVTILSFIALLFVAINFAPEMTKGLDQRVALPKDSYLVDYFNNLDDYLHTGPPAYFVVHSSDFSQYWLQDNICALGNSTCRTDSLLNYLRSRAMKSDDYYITGSVASFYDDLVGFLQAGDTCCGVDANGTYCNPNNNDDCLSCEIDLNSEGRPDPEQFYKWLPVFLNSTPSDACAMVGSPYQGDVQLRDDGTIEAARFRISHKILKTQSDYVNAVEMAYRMADDLQPHLTVFPYSIFYIYFEQYLYIFRVALESMLFAALAVFLVTVVVLLNPVISLFIVVIVAMIETDVIGFSQLMDVHLNAVSVVNFCMAMGISIEFVAHICYAYVNADGPTRDHRVAASVMEMGTSVFMGITLTKFCGVIILAFSKSRLFQVYYFRIYLMIVIFGGLHGLVLLPTLLSIFGPPRGGVVRYFLVLFGLGKPLKVEEEKDIDAEERHPLIDPETSVNADIVEPVNFSFGADEDDRLLIE